MMNAQEMTMDQILLGFRLQAETWKYEAMGVDMEAQHA